MKKIIPALAVLLLGHAAQAVEPSQAHGAAAHGAAVHGSKYQGRENRAVKSLSAADIAELKRGGGWGLARAAELNGVPGPAHLLALKGEIPLDDAQVRAIAKIFKRMQGRAIHQGTRLIALEEALEKHFRDRTITDAILRSSLSAISDARRKLRYIHLATHLETPDILSRDQIRTYNRLRGYSIPN